MLQFLNLVCAWLMHAFLYAVYSLRSRAQDSAPEFSSLAMASRLSSCSSEGLRLATEKGHLVAKVCRQRALQSHKSDLVAGLVHLPDVFWDASTQALFPRHEDSHDGMILFSWCPHFLVSCTLIYQRTFQWPTLCYST